MARTSQRESYQMSSLILWLRSWMQKEEGQDLAEYALLIGLIALVVLVAVTLLGTGLQGVFNRISGEVATWF